MAGLLIQGLYGLVSIRSMKLSEQYAVLCIFDQESIWGMKEQEEI